MHTYYTEELNDGNRDVGCPHLQINMEEITEMRTMGPTFTKTSIIIGVTRNTLYRVLEDSNLTGVCNRSSLLNPIESAVASVLQ